MKAFNDDSNVACNKLLVCTLCSEELALIYLSNFKKLYSPKKLCTKYSFNIHTTIWNET